MSAGLKRGNKIIFRLFRPKVVPVPTVAGFLFLTLVGCATVLLLVYTVPIFLALNSPIKHGLLVVEGWGSAESLRVAADTFKIGDYDAIVVSGGPIDDVFNCCGFKTYAERSAYVLKQLGIADAVVIIAPAPASAQDRTYRSAVSVRLRLEELGLKVTSLDVFSSGPHARRSRYLYQMAFGPHVEVGAIAAAPSGYDSSHWWRSSAGVKEILAEVLAYIWTLWFFDPGARGSWQEAWGNVGFIGYPSRINVALCNINKN